MRLDRATLASAIKTIVKLPKTPDGPMAWFNGDEALLLKPVSSFSYATCYFATLIVFEPPYDHGYTYCFELSELKVRAGDLDELLALVQRHVDRFASNLEKYRKPREFFEGGGILSAVGEGNEPFA